MLTDYANIALFLIVGVLFAVVTLVTPTFLKAIGIIPHKSTLIKTSTYECGLETIGETWVQFNFRYYFYALIFVVLDILVVFLYPWAVYVRQLGTYGLGGAVLFVIIVLVGYVYAWNKKVLEWK